MASAMRTARALRLASAARFASSTASNSAFAAPVTRETVLPSGLRVASEESSGTTATIGVWINAGSRFENDATNGTAHFLEHMAFKGTAARSQSALEREIENMGGHLNAYTSREQTVYYAQVLKADVPKAMGVLASILKDAALEPAAIERERAVILREAEEIAKKPEEVVLDLLHQTAYSGTPLARTILGPDANIRAITRANLVDYIAAHYTTKNMVIAGAGAVSQNQLCELAEKEFGGFSKGEGAKAPAHVASRFTGSAITLQNDALPEVHFALAVEGVSWTHPDSFALMVAQTLVGSYHHAEAGGKHLSSKLAHLVANNALAKSFSSFNTLYSDTGLWGVTAVATPATVEDLIYCIQQEWVRLAFSPAEGEVARARNQLKTNLVMALDGTSAVCEDIGRQMLTYRRRMSPAEIFARIDAVDADAVKRVAEEYLYNRSPALAVVGPLAGLPDFSRVESWMYWNRA